MVTLGLACRRGPRGLLMKVVVVIWDSFSRQALVPVPWQSVLVEEDWR